VTQRRERAPEEKTMFLVKQIAENQTNEHPDCEFLSEIHVEQRMLQFLDNEILQEDGLFILHSTKAS